MGNNAIHQRSGFKLFLLAALFIGPFILAWILFLNRDALHFTTLNNGQLIQPPLELANLNITAINSNDSVDQKILRGKWWIIYFNSSACDTGCKKTLHNLRQLWLVLGKDRDRVERMFLTFPTLANLNFDHLLAQEYPGMLHYETNEQDYLKFIEQRLKTAGTRSAIYIMDPQGRIMLTYPTTVAPKSLLKDLQRLLSVSQIG